MRVASLFLLCGAVNAFLVPQVAPRARSVLATASSRQLPTTALSMSADDDAKRFFTQFEATVDDNPRATRIISGAVSCAIGDLIAQASGLGSVGALFRHVDLKRLAIYTSIGGFLLAPIAKIWFNFLTRLTSGMEKNEGKFADKVTDNKDDSNALLKALRSFQMVFWDQVVGAPAVNAGYLFLYVALSSLTSGAGAGRAVNLGISKVQAALWPALVHSWKIWPVAGFVNFYLVPPKLRIAVWTGVGIFWNVILSRLCTGTF